MLNRRCKEDVPTSLPGFGNIKRYWDAKNTIYSAKILPGEYYVTRNENEAIVTVLGSCVSACISDRVHGVGGMNHFMLPQENSDEQGLGHWHANDTSSSTRYGNFAMEHLINEILKNGGKRENLELKVFGGGKIMNDVAAIGQRNIAFINDYINTEALSLVAEDVADIYPRKIMYYPLSGRARVKKLKSLHNKTVVARENSYMSTLKQEPEAGDVDLF